MLTIIELALFVPFFLVLTIFAIVYLINGYKRDFGNSLISLAATLITIGVSLLLAKLISRVVSGPIVSLLQPMVTNILSEFGTLGISLVEAVIEVFLAFFLFELFFVIGIAVLKTVGKNIKSSKLDKLNPGKDGTRIAGMGIRAIDAVLVTMMLLLPLYGGIAMAAPPAAAIARMGENIVAPQEQNDIPLEQFEVDEPSDDMLQQAGDFPLAKIDVKVQSAVVLKQRGGFATSQLEAAEPSISDMVEAVANHPVLAPYKYGPGSWIFSSLSNFSMNGKSMDIAAAINSLTGMLDRVLVCWEAIAVEDAEATVDAAEDLLEFTREEVIYQEWSYDIVMALLGEVDDFVESNSLELYGEEEELLELYEQLRPLLDMTFDEYTENAEGVLDFAVWLVEMYGKYGNEALSPEGPVRQDKELYVRLGEVLNQSEQAVGLKRIALLKYAEAMFDTLPDSTDPNYAEYYNARKDAPNTAAMFINEYFGDGIVPKKLRVDEAGVFLAMLDCGGSLDVAEIFVRHPSFGADAVLKAMDENLYINGSSEEIGQQLVSSDKADATYKALDKMLKDCEKKTYNEAVTFGDDVFYYLVKELGLEDIYGYVYTDDTDVDVVESESESVSI